MPTEHLVTKRYEILRRLGEGGMGVVYEAADRETGDRVALKTLPKADPDAIYRFKHEFRSLVGVGHPNLVRLYDLVEEAGGWFFTMELVDGVTFNQHVRRTTSAAFDATVEITADGDTVAAACVNSNEAPPFDERVLRGVLRQLAVGVQAIHDAGKVHRDLKPSNVMVRRDGRVVILDFGLVTEQAERSIGETVGGGIYGTPAYMAPEQARGEGATPASDWYAVGAILYEVLTGRLPFEGAAHEVLTAKQLAAPPAPANVVAGVPVDLSELSASLLRPDPQRRPTGQEVLSLLGTRAGATTPPKIVEKLVGRAVELDQLRAALAESREGPVCVLISGESGVGKTALVDAFARRAERDGAVVLRGRCYERESVPFKALDPIVDALSRHLRMLGGVEAASLLPRDVESLVRLFPVLRRVDVIASAPGRAEVADKHERRRRAFASLAELLGRLADRGELVVIIDDLQRGDDDSAELLREVLGATDPPRLLLLGAHRDETLEAECKLVQVLRSRELLPALMVHEVALGPLDEADAVRLFEESSGSTEPAIAVAAARAALGNPFFIGELARAAESPDARRSLLDSPAVVLDEIVEAHVAPLTETARGLMNVLALAGRPLARSVALRAAGGAAGADVVDDLQARSLVRGRGSGASAVLEPYHDRIRDAVVARLGPDTRRTAHLRLAEALEAEGDQDPELLLDHWLDAGETARAGTYCTRAADAAAEQLAFARAARLYERALDLGAVDGAADRRKLNAKLGDALANAGYGARAAAALQEAARGAPREESLDRRRRAAQHLMASGHLRDGSALLQEVIRDVGEHIPNSEAVALTGIVWRAAKLTIRGTRIRSNAVGGPSRRSGELPYLRSAMIGFAIVEPMRSAFYALEYVLRSLDAGDPYHAAVALSSYACTYLGRKGTSRREEAFELLDRATHLAGQDVYARAWVHSARALTHYYLSECIESLEEAERARELFLDCVDVAWERSAVRFTVYEAMGMLGEYRNLADVTRHEAREAKVRDDRPTMLSSALYGLVGALMTDCGIDESRAELDAIVRTWLEEGVPAMRAHQIKYELMLHLYRDDPRAAWRLVEELHGKELQRVLRHDSELSRAGFAFYESLAAVCLARVDPARRRELLARAARHAKQLERSDSRLTKQMSPVVEAIVANARGDTNREVEWLRIAVRRGEPARTGAALGLLPWRLGRLVGGDEGRRLVESALAFMKDRGPVDVERAVGMFGFR